MPTLRGRCHLGRLCQSAEAARRTMMVHNGAMVWDRAQQRRVDRAVPDCKCGMHRMTPSVLNWFGFCLLTDGGRKTRQTC